MDLQKQARTHVPGERRGKKWGLISQPGLPNAETVKQILVSLERTLNFDFCPWANHWVYWMKHPLVGLGVAALAAGLCGVAIAPQAWGLAIGLFGIILIGSIWPAIAIRGVHLEVEFPQGLCTEGDPVQAHIRATNRLPVPAWGLSITEGQASDSPEVSMTRLPGWRTSQLKWQFTPEFRGVYPRRPLWIETGFPFGIWNARKEVAVRGELLVLPHPVEVDAIPEMDGQLGCDESFSERRTGDSGDVVATRPYREGDSLRRVHWALTARNQRMICTERQAAVRSTICVALDLDKSHHAGTGPESSWEWSIRIFAGICKELAHQGICVQAMMGDQSIPVTTGQQGVRKFLSQLARIPAFEAADSGMPGKASSKANIWVTTNHSQPPDSSLTVVLDTVGFDDGDVSRGENAGPPCESSMPTCRNEIEVSGPASARSDFRAKWRNACNAVS